MDNLNTIADLLHELTYREIQQIGNFVAMCVVDNPQPSANDIAEWLLAWADAHEDDQQEPTP